MNAPASDPSARAHARLSASQAKRWMACPGSVKIIDEIPAKLRPGQSSFAALGTAAHTLGEACLSQGKRDSRDYKDYWIHLSGEIQKRTPDPDEPGWFQVDFDMMDAVDVYLSVVWGELERLGPAAELRIEHKFDLSWLRPDMFGTNDCSISLFLDELVVIDYKHGQGVPVEVYSVGEGGKTKPNPQLAYYGLGAAEADEFTHQKVTLIVVQPRCPHPKGGVRRYEMTMAELMEFKEELAAAADKAREAEEAWDPSCGFEGTEEWQLKYLQAGDHCKTAFCPKLGHPCPAAFRQAQTEAMADFADDPYELEAPGAGDSPDLTKLAHTLKWVPFLDAFIKSTEAHAQRLAETGIKVPEHKLVRKKANRSFIGEDDVVIAKLTAGGLQKADLMTDPKLKSPAQVEKLGKVAKELVNGVKNKDYDPSVEGSKEWLKEPLAAKGVGSITLAHESDPREEVVVDPAQDFGEDLSEYLTEGETDE